MFYSLPFEVGAIRTSKFAEVDIVSQQNSIELLPQKGISGAEWLNERFSPTKYKEGNLYRW